MGEQLREILGALVAILGIVAAILLVILGVVTLIAVSNELRARHRADASRSGEREVEE